MEQNKELRVDYRLRFQKRFTLGFDISRGCAVTLIDDNAKTGKLNIIPFHLEIVDELKQLSYSEISLPQDATIASSVQAEKLPDGIRFVKKYPEAPFLVEERWQVIDGQLTWRVKVNPEAGIRPRSIQIRQFFPNPQRTEDACPGWQVWTAGKGYPCSFLKTAFSRIIYSDALNIGTGIPILSLYEPGLDLGISLAKPLGLRIPRFSFCFDDYIGGGVTAESAWIKLAEDFSPEAELLIYMHEGDWRPGLGWFAKKYPTYFQPGNPKATEEIEGPFSGGRAGDAIKTAEMIKHYGAKAVEIHLHYACYGYYFPLEKEWVTREYTIAGPRPELLNRTLTREIIHRTIRMYQKKGIHPLVYIQLAGDCIKEYADKNFPESIAKTIYGNRMGQAWYHVYLMNSDPSLPFGKHIAAQLERFFELYPEASGLFWDQPCYDAIDTAHHDGITMVNNKPAYRLAFCYDTHRNRMVEEAHRRGMFVSSNGPAYIELAQGLDQIMSEGPSYSDTVKYFCIQRPMILWGDFSTKFAAEHILQLCLLTGATCPLASGKRFCPEVEETFFAYLPLLMSLRGRKWLLEANPLALPPGTEGNIFKLPDGKVCITLVSSCSVEESEIIFETKFRGIEKTKKVSYLTLGSRKWRKARFSLSGDRTRIVLPQHNRASTVIIG